MHEFETVSHKIPEFRYEEDGLTVTRGSAWTGPGCHLGCGVLMYTDSDGKLIKVEGDPENPFNQGRLCTRCLTLEDVLNSPDRLLHPMKRAKEDRGVDAWERISWDEAYDLIYENFTRLKEKYGPQTIACLMGTGRDISPWMTRLCFSMGSPNSVFMMSGLSCYTTRVVGCISSSGCFWVGDYSQQFADRYDDPAWKCPETVVVWGNNPIIANSDGLYGHWVVDVMKRGAKLIVIDPRMTWLGSKAELFLPVRPGTDAALALGMLNVIIQEGIYDREFVDKWCYGFEELAEAVSAYTLERTEEITWIPKEKIQAAARMIAESDGAVLQWGVALDMCKEALPTSQAAFDIFAITGQIEKPGGMIMPVDILRYSAGWGFDEFISPEMDQNRLGLWNKEYGLLRNAISAAHTDTMIKVLETEEPYKISGLWIQTTNFLACTAPDPKRTLAACNKAEFIAAVDLFMTPTIMALADVVLPVSCYPEKNGLRVGDGFQRLETINRAAEPGDTKPDTQINLELGKRFNPEGWPWADVDEMLGAFVKQNGGIDKSFEELQEMAPGYLPFEYHRHEKGMLRPDGTPGFNTPTGRIELWSTFFDASDLPPVPYYEEPTPSPYSTPDIAEEYPLVLTTGARTWWSFHSEHRQIPSLRKHKPWPIIEVHPDTAAKYGVQDGDWVWVENHRGRCKRVLKETRILDPKVVSTDHGWWLPEEDGGMDDGLFGMWDVDCNNLLKWECGKAGFGSNYKTGLCRIYKVEPGDEHNIWTREDAYSYVSEEVGE